MKRPLKLKVLSSGVTVIIHGRPSNEKNTKNRERKKAGLSPPTSAGGSLKER